MEQPKGNEEQRICLTDKQNEEVKENLIQYRDGLGKDVTDSLFDKDKVTGFTARIVEKVLHHCDDIITMQDGFNYTDVWYAEHATAILNIITTAKSS